MAHNVPHNKLPTINDNNILPNIIIKFPLVTSYDYYHTISPIQQSAKTVKSNKAHLGKTVHCGLFQE
jgi:hypothetical protein